MAGRIKIKSLGFSKLDATKRSLILCSSRMSMTAHVDSAVSAWPIDATNVGAKGLLFIECFRLEAAVQA